MKRTLLLAFAIASTLTEASAGAPGPQDRAGVMPPRRDIVFRTSPLKEPVYAVHAAVPPAGAPKAPTARVRIGVGPFRHVSSGAWIGSGYDYAEEVARGMGLLWDSAQLSITDRPKGQDFFVEGEIRTAKAFDTVWNDPRREHWGVTEESKARLLPAADPLAEGPVCVFTIHGADGMTWTGSIGWSAAQPADGDAIVGPSHPFRSGSDEGPFVFAEALGAYLAHRVGRLAAGEGAR